MKNDLIRVEAEALFYDLNPELLPYDFPEDYPLPDPVKPSPVRPVKSTRERARTIQGDIVELVADMASHAEIVRYCAENYGIRTRQAEKYIARAREQIREQVEQEYGSCLAGAIERLKALREQVSQEQDYRTLLQVEREINRILLPSPGKRSESVSPVEREPVIINENDIVAAVIVLLEAGGINSENRERLRASLDR